MKTEGFLRCTWQLSVSIYTFETPPEDNWDFLFNLNREEK